MIVIKREDYEEILKKLSLSIESTEKCIDVYHKNNWDRFTMHYDEENKNECPSYIDFFFNAKVMVDFLKTFIEKENFEKCYIAPLYNDRYKLKSFDDDVCKDVYDEFKALLNSLGLKTNTSSAIQMQKNELLKWCDRISIGAFCGVSQYAIVIPELDLLIIPYHHMNFLLYSNDKDTLLTKINVDEIEEVMYQD